MSAVVSVWDEAAIRHDTKLKQIPTRSNIRAEQLHQSSFNDDTRQIDNTTR